MPSETRRLRSERNATPPCNCYATRAPLLRTRSRRRYSRQRGFRKEAPDGHQQSCVHGPSESYADLSSSARALGRRAGEPLGITRESAYADEIFVCEGDLIGKTRERPRSLHLGRARD